MQRSLLFSLTIFFFLAILLCLLTPTDAAEERDLYKILGLKRDADDAQIKRAYRKMSLKYHPDKNKGDETAAKMFQDIAYANEVLSDPDKRQTYDIYGEEGLEQEKQAANRPSGGIWDLFGGGGGAGGKRRGPDFRIDFPVTLEDLYNSETRQVAVKRKVICKTCRGTGAKDGATRTCPQCHGKGQVMTIQQLGPGFNVQMQTTCDRCGGRGKIPKAACPVCGGSKLVMEEKKLDVIIEKGMRDGQEVSFERASEQSPDTIPGNVIVTLRQQPHSRFTRRGDHLHMEHTITLKEALLGFSFTIPHLDGRRVTISQEGVTQPEFVKTVKGEGMPLHSTPSIKGDLFVKFIVRFPSSFTAKQQETIKSLL